MTSREQIMTALLAALTAAGGYNLIGRRLRNPETIPVASTPALMLVEPEETYTRPSPSLPPKRVLDVAVFLYTNAGGDENIIPASVLNNLLDGIDAALAPDRLTGRCTLGGLVESARIDGKIIKAAGDVTGLGMARVPIQIVIP